MDVSRGERKPARDAAIWALTRKVGVKNAEVAERFGISYAAASHAARRVEEEMNKTPAFRKQVERFCEMTS